MDALSLSHLTYFVDATITVNFHRLDHPPFPCTHKLLHSQSPIKSAASMHLRHVDAASDISLICKEKIRT
jgi:hypothetical protein